MTSRRLAAELVGTAFLLLAIVGSGIATSVDGASSAQLFQHAVVVGAALVALILALGHVSGAHLNPAVTLAERLLGGMTTREAWGYVAAQLAGAVLGVLVANAIFAVDLVAVAGTERTGLELVVSEAVATFGLLLVIVGVVRSPRPQAVAVAVGTYIAAAISFTSSTSFANPAVTIARTLTDTWTGIAPGGVVAFVVAQLAAAAAGTFFLRWLFDDGPADLVVPHEHPDLQPEEALR